MCQDPPFFFFIIFAILWRFCCFFWFMCIFHYLCKWLVGVSGVRYCHTTNYHTIEKLENMSYSCRFIQILIFITTRWLWKFVIIIIARIVELHVLLSTIRYPTVSVLNRRVLTLVLRSTYFATPPPDYWYEKLDNHKSTTSV